LQSPTFFPYGKDPNYLNFLNLGGFGSVAGHEISHGFDQNGRHYDENGTLTDWWTETTVKGFEKRETCFVDQYGGFTVKVWFAVSTLTVRPRMGRMCISMVN
jgi:predicted metalloendopeptidase